MELEILGTRTNPVPTHISEYSIKDGVLTFAQMDRLAGSNGDGHYVFKLSENIFSEHISNEKVGTVRINIFNDGDLYTGEAFKLTDNTFCIGVRYKPVGSEIDKTMGSRHFHLDIIKELEVKFNKKE